MTSFSFIWTSEVDFVAIEQDVTIMYDWTYVNTKQQGIAGTISLPFRYAIPTPMDLPEGVQQAKNDRLIESSVG